ncbi:tetratricopeptide repeat protein [Odoribacter sp. OttesenSCG-928-L07]|nr:tetratricopeptide repeat protein [Odoribacter sp. OttesenSCG-928-L07]MDL2239702.1 tetratricopeptide repeat protein [Bacteroidales bacterium OttesenSCG-928-L14]MDL2240807.1 tetratricopeptide repeat protein [Bacteroidales bacterium OttesenSCG-928-K22]
MKTRVLILLLAIFPLISIAQTDQNIKDLPKYGNDSVQCITNLSLYREYFKQWKQNRYPKGEFDAYYHNWKWVYDNCPKASLNTYVDGVNIIYDKINNAATEEIKEAYIDSLMMLYDQRILCFGDKGNVLSRKGLDLLRLRPGNAQEIYNILDESINIQKNKTTDATIDAYFRTTVQLYRDEVFPKELIIENYEKVSEIIDYNINNNVKEKDKYINVKSSVESVFEPFANCEDLIPLYEKKFAESPDDIPLLEKISSMLAIKGCTGSKLFHDVSVKYHQLNPSPESAYMLGTMMYKDGKYQETIKYLNEAVNMKDPGKAANAHYMMADCYRLLENFPKAREEAYKAYELDKTNGEPLIFIGELYGQSNKLCPSSNPVEAGCIYWVAVDMFNQAKRVDPSQAERANKNIALYSQYFPNAEAIFYSELMEGDDYEVGCWINKTTKIRALKK